MTDYSFAYGDASVTISLDERQVLDVVRGNRIPPVTDIAEALRSSLDHPIDSAPLSQLVRPGKRIALIVSDMTRFWMRQDRVVPHLISYLNRCGARDGDITILIACGTHEGGDEQELRKLVTDGIYDRIRVVNHDCEADDLVSIGTTAHGTAVEINRIAAEADLVIALGAATYHVMAGYGGGRKSIVPGISSLSTIRHNHAFALDPQHFRSNPLIGNGVTRGNPLNEDMCEAAALLPNLFVINLVMNADMQLSSIFSGHYLTSWQRACRAVDEAMRVPVPQRADVIVASCGGFPKDMSLYQGTKTIDNIEFALKPGGTLIIVMEARDGGGPAEYFDWIGPLVDGSFEEKLRSSFTIPGYIFLLNCEQAQRYRILMLTGVAPEVLAPMGIRAFSDPDALLAAADLAGKSIYVIPNGSAVMPYVEGES
ncbi:MAG: nickel-dependent lactate racemase [Clostridia bacterium]|nr:nickel-dependent lactate racemase [Clostridia bacterium]